MKVWIYFVVPMMLLVLIYACGDDAGHSTPPDNGDTTTADTVTYYTYRIVNVYPHDRNAFTQGLFYHDGYLYEGTGQWMYYPSTLRRVDLETGHIEQEHNLDSKYFGEGITLLGNLIVQLTWLNKTAFVYDRESFEPVDTFYYSTQGWGITYDGHHLIMSDGSHRLRFLDPTTYSQVRSVEVRGEAGYVTQLNELEYIAGKIYANIWRTKRIVIIEPATGKAVGWIDCAGLLKPEDLTEPVDVMNGIAYDAVNGRLFVTGKLWPKLFEIELVTQ